MMAAIVINNRGYLGYRNKDKKVKILFFCRQDVSIPRIANKVAATRNNSKRSPLEDVGT